MKVWLLTVGEPLPIEGERQRLHRTGTFAEFLVQLGIEVVWWTSTFRHAQKDKLFTETTRVEVSDKLKLWCLDAPPYRRNISVQRILSNRGIARQFASHAPSEPTPDVLLASYPIPELAAAGASYARAKGIPSVVDIRDLWPDIWPMVLPSILRPPAKVGLWPFYRQSRQVLRQFDAITGITNEIVQWGVDRAGRPRTPSDQGFPLAYPLPDYPEAAFEEARRYWSQFFVADRKPDLRICFFGNLTPRACVDVLIKAVRALPTEARTRIQVVVCGIGEMLETLKNQARDLPQVLFPGWVDGPKISVLATLSDIGALPYASDPDFVKSIPNKAIEYLAYGLPVLTSLSGVVTDLIQSTNCGRLYAETDPQDLSRVISDLLNDPSQLRPLSANATRVYRDRFQVSEVYGRYADLLVALAEPSPHNAA